MIEDRFGAGRPRLEESGATMVADVAPYELAKLRLLNGAHSALAYLGYLAGYETIADAMADPAFARFARGLMDEEARPTLAAHGVGDLTDYKRRLLERFENPALRHRTWQIAMDGSQKLPQRLLGTARERLAAGAPIARLALAVAGWMRYVTGIDELGRAIDVRDPLAARLKAIADAAGPDAARLAPALLSVREIFGDDLAADRRFVRAVTRALAALYTRGARRAVEEFESWSAELELRILASVDERGGATLGDDRLARIAWPSGKSRNTSNTPSDSLSPNSVIESTRNAGEATRNRNSHSSAFATRSAFASIGLVRVKWGRNSSIT